MESGFVICSQHGAGAQLGVSLGKAVGNGLGHLNQFLCAIRGHELFLRFEPRRLSLRCESCGYESPGWEIGPPPSDAPRARRAHDRFAPRSPRIIPRAAWIVD